MPASSFPLIAVTLGDPGGIGPEVTVKALGRMVKEKVHRKARFILIGPPEIYESWNQKLKSRLSFESILLLDRKKLKPGRIYILDLSTALPSIPANVPGRIPLRVIPSSYAVGEISRNNAFLAYASLRVGAYLAACGLVDGLVTAPVHKEAMRLVDEGFVGHTEYLAGVSKTRDVAMMFDGGPVKITLVTVHVPLNEVSAALTRRDIEIKIQLTDRFLKKFYKIKKPRIAVSALNPHGSEFGAEEKRKILPAIRSARRKGITADGPFPGDTLFHEACRAGYHAAVFMYHDQGLAPLKAVAFDRAVNLTLGLPFIRTSPDHGTAFDLAGRGKADERSMAAALRTAVTLCRSL